MTVIPAGHPNVSCLVFCHRFNAIGRPQGWVRLADKGEGGIAVERLAGKPKYHATKGFGTSCLISAPDAAWSCPSAGVNRAWSIGWNLSENERAQLVTDSMEAHQYMNRTYSHVSNCRAARRDGRGFNYLKLKFKLYINHVIKANFAFLRFNLKFVVCATFVALSQLSS